jgi:phosphoribosylamine---glycine ligase
MRILLLGSGGREHAMAWKIRQSQLCNELFIAPGNAGTAQCGTNINITVNDFEQIGNFCLEQKIDMVIPGSEEPLVLGIYDYFKNKNLLQHIPVIGPSKTGAQLEGSKAFAKAFMQRHQIPTAAYREFDSNNFEEGKEYLQQHSLPVVLKVDGLAAGKGVVICESHEAALQEYEAMIQQHKFGDAGKKVVVEEFLSGIELSAFVLTDGKNYLLLPEAKDYKRIGEGDTGLNTGGMGAISPVPFADKNFMQKVTDKIIMPTISGLIDEKIDYKGFIFFGLIKVGKEPFVIEYNCRLGDPETEVVLPRLKNDLVELFAAVAGQNIHQLVIEQDDRVAATIMLVSAGYPEKYEKGKEIAGLPDFTADQMVFQAGTKINGSRLLTNGGRVMSVTSLAISLLMALEHSVQTAAQIQFEGKYFRKDIGWEFLK